MAQTWAASGKLATLVDANGNTTSFAYDGFDRLATTTYPGGSTETFTYNAVDNRPTRKTRAADRRDGNGVGLVGAINDAWAVPAPVTAPSLLVLRFVVNGKRQ